MTIRSHKDLEVWKKGKNLTPEVYRATQNFPREELYGLVSQMRRSAVSVPANIAEGQGRNSSREYLRHLSIAYGSLCELETHIIVAEELAMLPASAAGKLLDMVNELGKMLNGLQNKIAAKISPDLRPLTSDLKHEAAL